MSVFSAYAPYYELFYPDKAYGDEAAFVDRLLQKHGGRAETLLELGCGTGSHAQHLLAVGYRLFGVDRSPEMIERARQRLAGATPAGAKQLELGVGDIRDLRLERQFDAVIALFHVISYMEGSDELRRAFATARAHLHGGGVFLFDYWYGPAVLADPPAVRVKRAASGDVEVTRIAEPENHLDDNLVDVHYQINVRHQDSGRVEEIHETHRMHYLFTPELRLLLQLEDFEPLVHGTWMTESPPSPKTYSAYCVARAK